MQEQHLVPQQISAYHFRLVGDMTLKQFLQVATGVGISLLFYALPLPSLIQWPFMIIFALFGAAFAFVPVQDRPLDQWLLAFFRSIYSPTIFNWQQTIEPPQYFSVQATGQEPVPPLENKNLQTTDPENKLDVKENSLLSSISSLIGAEVKTPVPLATTIPPTIVTPNIAQPTTKVSSRTIFPPPSDIPTLEKPKIIVPEIKQIKVEHKGIVETTPEKIFEQFSRTAVAPTLAIPKVNAPGVAPQFSEKASPPMTPDQSNIIVGQVIDSQGKMMEGVILEIRDVMGRPARALRTNNVGHFRIVTPLTVGKYKVTIEKDDYEFDPITIEANDTVIPPISIQAKNA